MSETEAVIAAAHREAAPALGEMALALAARRYRPGSLERWIVLLRSSADRLEALATGRSRA